MDSAHHPDSFVCPILGTLMADPVMALDGHTYERNAIVEWFRTSDISPMTGAKVESKSLVPNHALRKAIDDYCKKNPERLKEREASKITISAKGQSTSASTQGKLAGAKQVQPTSSESERAPWEFDKKLLATSKMAEKKPVILSTSRTSLYTGEGVLVGFEPTADGNSFEVAMTLPLKLEGKYESDASMSSLCRISDNTFVAGRRNGALSVWRLERNPATGKLAPKRIWQASDNLHTDETTCVAYIPGFELVETTSSSYIIASGSRDQTVKLWRPSKDSVSWSFVDTLDHRAEVRCVVGAMEGHIISGGADWSLKMWDPNVPTEPVRVLDSHSRAVRCVCADKTGRFIASGAEDECVVVWDVRAPDPVVKKIDTGSPVLSICWGDDFLCAGGGTAGDSMTGSSYENTGGWLRFWDPRTWRVLSDAVVPLPKAKVGTTIEKSVRPRSAHDLATNVVSSFSLAGNRAVISGGDDKKLRMWLSPPFSDDPFLPAPSLAYELGGEKVLPIAVDALVTMFV